MTKQQKHKLERTKPARRSGQDASRKRHAESHQEGQKFGRRGWDQDIDRRMIPSAQNAPQIVPGKQVIGERNAKRKNSIGFLIRRLEHNELQDNDTEHNETERDDDGATNRQSYMRGILSL